MAVLIPVSKGRYYTCVDEDDYNHLAQWSWRYIDGYACRSGYAINNDGKRIKRTIRMHSVVNNTQEGYETDHINGDKLDNRKSNLRSVTHSQNQMNRGVNKNSSSGFKGVGWCKQTNKWRVSISIKGKFKNLGRFSSIKDAIEKYNQVAKVYHGEYVRLNIKQGEV